MREAGRRALLLGRVSRGERTQDPEVQLRVLRAAAARLGIEVAGELPFVCSAWTDEAAAEVRTAVFNQLAISGADTLMVWALDRLTRGGVAAAFRLLARLEQHLGIVFWSHEEPFLSTGTDPQQRELMLSIRAWVARWESQRRSERLLARAAHKRDVSARLGNRATWGRGRMPTPQEHAEVHRLRAQDPPVSFRAIARALGLPLGTVHRAAGRVPILPGAAGALSTTEPFQGSPVDVGTPGEKGPRR
jgi:DNA invertase Pin-like site-specific DNA recombinase